MTPDEMKNEIPFWGGSRHGHVSLLPTAATGHSGRRSGRITAKRRTSLMYLVLSVLAQMA